MPPLRSRRDDVGLLAEHFIAKAARKCKTRVKSLAPEARVRLADYDWPGNVRELENVIERALVLGTTDAILPEDLPEALLEAATSASSSPTKYYEAIREFKKQLVLRALQQANQSYLEAAKALGMHPNSLLRLIRNLGLRSSAVEGKP
jgi:DNA-binding NtrC family response regulator